MDRSEEAQTNNYQVELTIVRDGKTARYRTTLNGGQVSREFVDKVAKGKGDVLMISLQVSLMPFEGGAEASIFLGPQYACRIRWTRRAARRRRLLM